MDVSLKVKNKKKFMQHDAIKDTFVQFNMQISVLNALKRNKENTSITIVYFIHRITANINTFFSSDNYLNIAIN
jgi:hypothetical protein